MRVEGPHRLGLRSVIGRIEWKLDHARGGGRRTGTGYDVFFQDSEASSMGRAGVGMHQTVTFNPSSGSRQTFCQYLRPSFLGELFYRIPLV